MTDFELSPPNVKRTRRSPTVKKCRNPRCLQRMLRRYPARFGLCPSCELALEWGLLAGGIVAFLAGVVTALASLLKQ